MEHASGANASGANPTAQYVIPQRQKANGRGGGRSCLLGCCVHSGTRTIEILPFFLCVSCTVFVLRVYSTIPASSGHALCKYIGTG